ncbi:MAG TPA: hypothetical protein VFM65_05760 [Flavobacteriaceae bacterium]|nr:hypothetical protein [Flavobacteriaceae bacterium]
MKFHFFKYLFLFSFFTQNLSAQSPDDALLWLQQHQEKLTYRIENGKGSLEKSFRFLPDKIVEQTLFFDAENNSWNKSNEDWFYHELEPITDINNLPLDTINKGAFYRVMLSSFPVPMHSLSDEGEALEENNAVFHLYFGFRANDTIAKQNVWQAVQAIMQLVRHNDGPPPKHKNVWDNYKKLPNVINQPQFSLPPSKGYSIKTALKDHHYLEISQSQFGWHQSCTISLRKILSFARIPDTTNQNKDFIHFVLKMEDSVLIEISGTKNKSRYIKRPEVVFTMLSPYLIAETTELLNNICLDNNRRRKKIEYKILENTNCPPALND